MQSADSLRSPQLQALCCMRSMEAKLEIQSIWEDAGLFEIRVKGTDGKFAGEIECYTNRDAIEKLANQLIIFPKTIEDVVDFPLEKKTTYLIFL